MCRSLIFQLIILGILIMEKDDNTSHHKILHLLYAAIINKTLTLVGKYGIADIIGQDIVHISTIAEKAQVDEYVLYRFLRALADIDIFEEIPHKKFKNTELSETFLEDNPKSLKDMLIWCDLEIYLSSIEHLDHSLQTGESAFFSAYGENMFSYFEHHKNEAIQFDKAMTALTQMSLNNLLKSYDFSTYHSIVDIGGGVGSFLTGILKNNMHLKAVLFDTQGVISHFNSINKDKNNKTIIGIAGDFFESVPENYDLYLMKHVSHNWSDEKLVIILKNIQQAMKEDSKLLIIDRIIDTDTSFAKWLDITMLTFTPEGRERTLDEFEHILSEADLRILKVIETNEQEKIIEIIQ